MPGSCTSPAPGSCDGATSSITWSAAPDAIGYDVIAGDLFALRTSAGDLRPYTCLGNDQTSTSFDIEPAAAVGHPSWYLVRAVYPSSNGTYDEGGNQVGSRDPESADCP